ncbi:MotA/TolQ/ExbB proton channel family protein [Cylindrospermopsis raciborskii]|uniref:MotA/TolQ/ExbB proton channel family protein n=1 Tax=Cylindrospermopsis raciborskii TaxID=77022 RepID=UPI000E1F1978|nr:MotA/TolQ/ExbB proton channel family protein [Cylindrospermopsis raciborskii]UJL32330.1 MotA/TolQ/ExbB proton channel family protein [Cylindrospermopsis raciborskii Cr2010]UJS04768.1 MotA/TolQ/ExbB proton channel family protein [Cylindrospermopsis raciborskii KLL07]
MKAKFILNSLKSDRRELDVSFLVVSGIGLVITLAIYGLLFPIKNTFIGILLYERGFTQILTIAFAGIVAALTLLKFFKLQKQSRTLGEELIPSDISLDDPTSDQVINLQQNLAQEKNVLARRCSRLLAVYINSGNRQIANEFSLEDSAFYHSASESSYTIPKILVWAIPLLGFIGTVFGISASVGGFTGFLENAGDIDQIKQGIGTVTQGLAIAFDTTLLALFMSVLVMLPLVMVERLESRLLLAIDIYINDKVLPRLKDTSKGSETISEEMVEQAVIKAVQQNFLAPETLIEPAKHYAEQAAVALAKGFTQEVHSIQEAITQTVQEIQTVRERVTRESQDFSTFLGDQIKLQQGLVNQIQTTVQEIHRNHLAVSDGFREQALVVGYKLEAAAQALEQRISSLEKYATQISEIDNLQRSLDNNLRNLKEKAVLEGVLGEIQTSLERLRPTLDQLNKPRRILLLEQEDQRT